MMVPEPLHKSEFYDKSDKFCDHVRPQGDISGSVELSCIGSAFFLSLIQGFSGESNQ